MMNRIAIISLDNIYATPYIKEYLKVLDGENVDIIYWNRTNVKEDLNSFKNCYAYINKSKRKFLGYIGFQKYITNILKKNNYSKLILLHSPLNFLLNKTLKKYKKKYIIDIRDFSYENFKIYNFIQSKNIKNAFFTVISSSGYQSFLPKSNYIMLHNIFSDFDDNDLKKIDTKKIIITQVGSIRFIDQNIKVINYFKGNEKFHLKYIGKGSEQLQNCISQNVELEGYFDPEETLKKYSDADFINNLYGNETMSVKYALSNKLYIAALLEKPILVSPKTYMEEIVNKYDLGLALDLNNTADLYKVEKYLQSLDREEFKKNCKKFLADVQLENQQFYKKLVEFKDYKI